jgi:hypothetical protein
MVDPGMGCDVKAGLCIFLPILANRSWGMVYAPGSWVIRLVNGLRV